MKINARKHETFQPISVEIKLENESDIFNFCQLLRNSVAEYKRLDTRGHLHEDAVPRWSMAQDVMDAIQLQLGGTTEQL